MKPRVLIAVVIAGAAALSASAREQAQTATQTEEAARPSSTVSIFDKFLSLFRTTPGTPVDDNGLPAFHPQTRALHRHRVNGRSGEYIEREVVAPEAPAQSTGLVTLSREEYDALRDLAARAQALIDVAERRDGAGSGETAAAAGDTSTSEPNQSAQSSVPVLTVALPAAAAVTRRPNQAPSATGIPQLRRKMKREE